MITNLRYHATTWALAGAAAFALALIPIAGHAASADANEAFCELVADYAHIAATARDQGWLLGQFKSTVAKHSDAAMRPLIYKIGTIVYTSEDFADLNPEQAMRYAYRTCMTMPAN